jgi:hypothetical protein
VPLRDATPAHRREVSVGKKCAAQHAIGVDRHGRLNETPNERRVSKTRELKISSVYPLKQTNETSDRRGHPLVGVSVA